MKKHALMGLLALTAYSSVFAARIVTLTPDVADVVVALGSGKEVVGRDMATMNPALKNVPVLAFSVSSMLKPWLRKNPRWPLVLGWPSHKVFMPI